MDKKIEIIMAGDPDYEELVAEIYVGEKYVAHLSQENGKESLKLNLPAAATNEDAVTRSVDLDVFRRALQLAENRILND